MAIHLSDHFTHAALIRFTMPTIGMMLFTSAYVIVDGFFISNFIGKTAFAAVNLIFPFLMILATVGFIFGTGGSALVAKKIGQGKKEIALRYFSLFVYTTLTAALVLAAAGLIVIRPVALFLGAYGDILENCVVYGRIILLSLPFYALQIVFQIFLVTAEKPQLGFVVTLIAGGINIVLDAALIVLLPPHYKLIGAALATALGCAAGALIPVIYFMGPNSSLLRLGKTVWVWPAVRKAMSNGLSEFMTNISMSLVAMLYNYQLLKYAGANGVAAYGVIMYVSMIFSAMFIGYAVGIAPVISYNLGAKNYQELRGVLRKSLALIAICGILMFLAAQITARWLTDFFVGYDKELAILTIYGLRIFAFSFLLMGFAIFGSSFFTAMNDGKTSALISFLRALVFQVAFVLCLPAILGVTGIWMSDVMAEVMAVMLTLLFLWRQRKTYY